LAVILFFVLQANVKVTMKGDKEMFAVAPYVLIYFILSTTQMTVGDYLYSAISLHLPSKEVCEITLKKMKKLDNVKIVGCFRG